MSVAETVPGRPGVEATGMLSTMAARVVHSWFGRGLHLAGREVKVERARLKAERAEVV